MKIIFDKSEINTASGGMLALNIRKTLSNWNPDLIPMQIDTINYIAIYTIKPGTCAQIEGGNNRRPNFHYFKEIEIFTGTDTLRLLTKEQMRKAFDADRKKTTGKFDLIIQQDGKFYSY